MTGPTAVPAQPLGKYHKRDTALWLAIILSVGLHFVAFSFWPDMQAEELLVQRSELTSLDLPPEVDIPQAPRAIARPAVPVVATTDVSEDVTIAPTTFDANPVSELPLPPPPSEETAAGALGDQPTFTPFTVRPRLLNKAAAQALLVKEYPQLLKDAGIGGVAQVWFFLDTDGHVLDARIESSSGHVKLDEAALRVARGMKFSPALNRDTRVQVWVRFPIIFEVR